MGGLSGTLSSLPGLHAPEILRVQIMDTAVAGQQGEGEALALMVTGGLIRLGTRGGEAVLMSPPVTRARLVWLLLLRGAEGVKVASEGVKAVRPKREVGTRDSVGGWVRVGG